MDPGMSADDVGVPSGRVVFGLDGCPSGWVAVRLDSGTVVDVRVVDCLADIVGAVPPGPEPGSDAGVVLGVDMPVGLWDGPRDADRAARALLPGRASTVFDAASKQVVEGWASGQVTSHQEASALNRKVSGAGLSQQSWRLVPKMAEVVRSAAAGAHLVEVHPELAFAMLAGGPLPRKRSWAGVQVRRGLLAGVGVHLPDRFERDEEASPDDVVDAAICAWVADGVSAGSSSVRTVPASTSQMCCGRPIVMMVRHRAGPPGRTGFTLTSSP